MTSRKSERSKNMPVSLSPRIQSLFHHAEGEEPKFHRRLEKIHTNPAIYLVRNFLSDVDLDYLDRNITQHASKFKASYTEDENGKKCVSEERTSTYIFLDKGRDVTIRNLEMRASGKISHLSFTALLRAPYVNFIFGWDVKALWIMISCSTSRSLCK